MKPKEFWREYDIAEREHKKWEDRAGKVVKRFRQELDSQKDSSFNILGANTSVMMPALFSQVPKPDIRRRYRDDDPIAKQGARLLERGLEFVMDDGDFYNFGTRSVLDYLLPGRTVCKVRYSPLIAKTRKPIEVNSQVVLSPLGEEVGRRFFLDDEELDPSEVRIKDERAFVDQEVEEVIDESVIIERWPWRNFIHQKANRWEDVGWVDFISYMDKTALKRFFGSKANDIKLTVDSSGRSRDQGQRPGNFKPTHAEIHEVWFKTTREIKFGTEGDRDKWLKETDDPLRLENFYPTPQPLMAVDTNDSLEPVPLFVMYQHQANELDTITRRISILMKALKLAGLYAGSEKATLQRLFEAEENTMIPVEDWAGLQQSGGVERLVSWLPIEQVGKVLTALFAEREKIVQQIFELTGIADIVRGTTDPRETRGAQALKAQFSSRRTLIPKQNLERYFRDSLRIAAEIMAEHFSPETLQKMTGLEVPEEVHELLQNELSRQYRIDIETDSTVAPDEERDKAQMAEALTAVSQYITAMAPLIQQGLPPILAVVLLKTYLRKFRFGREIEEVLEQMQNLPPAKEKPDPEQMKAQIEMQKQQQEMQMKQRESQLKLQEIMAEIQLKMEEMRQEIRMEREKHVQELRQDEEAHTQELRQTAEKAAVQAEAMRRQGQAREEAIRSNPNGGRA